MLPSRVPCPPYAYAYVCACMCACARGRRVLLCVEGRGGREVMLPWRVPCSPDKGFLKKRGMPARCWVSSCASLASFSCTTTSLLRYTSRHTALPSLPLGPSDGVSPLQPHVWYHEPIYLTAVLPPQKASSVEPVIGPELSILN